MKNKILRWSVTVAVIMLVLAVSAIDSNSNIPFITALASMGYISLFIYANR